MAYTLKTTGFDVRTALVVDQAGTGIQDLVSGNTFALGSNASATFASATYRGSSRNYFQLSGSTLSADVNGLFWTGTKPSGVLADGTQGLWFFVVLNGYGASFGAGTGNPRALFTVNGASQRWEVRVGDTYPNMGRYNAESYTSADANHGNAQSAYFFQARYGVSGSRSRTAAGTFSTLDTDTDGGLLPQDALFTQYGASYDTWWQPQTFIAVAGLYDTDTPSTLPDSTTLNAWADDWFGTFIDAPAGPPPAVLSHYYSMMRSA